MLNLKTDFALFAWQPKAQPPINGVARKIRQVCVWYFLTVLCLLHFTYSLSAEEIHGNFFRQKNDANLPLPENYVEENLNIEIDSLIDISGTWQGVARVGTIEADMTFVLFQDGDSVTGTWESPGAYPTKCGLWTGSITGNVAGNIFSFNATSPLKDLETCEVICLDDIVAKLAIKENCKRMIGSATEQNCEDGSLFSFTYDLTKEDDGTIPPQRCVGATGPQCGFLVKHNRDGSFSGFVTVGSILHDNCCIQHYPDGYWCRNGGEDQSVCMDEWKKARSNFLHRRGWWVKSGWGPYAECQGDDITPVPARKSVPQAEYETAATSRLAAPSGTKLDDTDEDFCQSKTFQKKEQGFGICN
jgi:hypothetical protein